MLRILLILFLFISTTCLAGLKNDSIPKALQDKGTQPISVVREITTHLLKLPFPGASKEPCHFRFTDSFFGYLELEDYYLKDKLPFNFLCYDANAKIVGAGPVKFDEEKRKWVRHFPNRLKGEGVEYSAEGNLELDRAIHFYELTTVSADGYAYTEDDLTGDEDARHRKLHYCLIHPPKALCGTGDMGYLSDFPKGDLTAYSLKILSSIEFIDDEPSPPSH